MSKEIDGNEYVTWEYVKHPMCHVCEWPQPNKCDTQFEMIFLGNGSYSDGVGSTWECKTCKTQVIINHTFRIESVEEIRTTE
jgi:hypothetical protein